MNEIKNNRVSDSLAWVISALALLSKNVARYLVYCLCLSMPCIFISWNLGVSWLKLN